MLTDRMHRQVERLLDEADRAIASGDWTTVRARCEAVLRIDPDNADAQGYLAAAQRDDAGLTTAHNAAAQTDSPPAPALPEAFVDGRFRVLGLLGEGGKKVVYRVHDTQLDREVAFALLKTNGLDADGRERVRREARTLGRLSAHPNIVTVHEVGDDDGRPFIVAELMQGGDLQQLVAGVPDRRIPLPRVLAIGGDISRALAFAHGKGVIHRDLKPGNVWLTEDGAAKLGDFGLAIAADDPRLTRAGMMVGTALYMAPEQAAGGEVTPFSDLYSFGCLLYELVAGRPPFVGDESVAIIGQHLHANPVALTWHRPDCPSALEALILRLLEKDPRRRPASASDVAEALAGVLLSAGPSERTPGGRPPAPNTGGASIRGDDSTSGGD
ncbi:MAG: serine/threonine-protein kinase, partial [Dehalococcoidia bacterium]